MSKDASFRIVTDNQIQQLDLSANPEEVDTLPVDHLKTPWRSRVMRSAPREDLTITQRVLGNSPAKALVADCFSIHNHNLAGADVYRIELFEGPNQSGSVAYDSSFQSASVLIPLGVWMCGVDAFGATYSDDLDKISTVWFEPVVYQSFRLTIKSHSNSRGYIQLGMLFLGKSLRFENNFSWGNELSWNTGLMLTRTEGGSLVTESQRPYAYRELTLDLEWLTDADRNSMAGKLRAAAGQPILVAAYPTVGSDIRRTEYTMIAKLDTGNRYTHQSINRHSTQLRFLEV